MKKRVLIIGLLIALLAVPVVGTSEFVFEETPVESHDTTAEPKEAVTEPSATPEPNAQPTLSPTVSSGGETGSIVSFGAVEPMDPSEVPIFVVPTKAPIANDTWPKEIVVSFGGDCTIGNTVGQSTSPLGFKAVVEREGFAWPFSGLVNIFSQDDLTLVNFEGTLTTEEDRAEKLYNFKGPPEYSTILQFGSVEAVNLANNHFIDYGEQGQIDTMEALDKAGIVYCRSKNTAIFETRGVKIGLIGNAFPYKDEKRDISGDVKALREAGCQIVIASFHWGSEGEYGFSREQRKIGKAAINSGADIVVGHHSHVIQSIEKYEGTYILYSLGNLVFGGNVSPDDKDTFIAQATFLVNEDGTLEGEPKLRLIPVLMTGESKGTDYRPIVASGEKDYERIMKKILNKATNMEDFVNPR